MTVWGLQCCTMGVIIDQTRLYSLIPQALHRICQRRPKSQKTKGYHRKNSDENGKQAGHKKHPSLQCYFMLYKDLVLS
jgi:hypothetical protein